MIKQLTLVWNLKHKEMGLSHEDISDLTHSNYSKTTSIGADEFS